MNTTLKEQARSRIFFLVDNFRRGGWLHLGRNEETETTTMGVFKGNGDLELVQFFPHANGGADQRTFLIPAKAVTAIVSNALARQEEGK